MELEAVLLTILYNVFRENYIRIFIDMDSYAQLGDRIFKAKVVSEVRPEVTLRIFLLFT